MRKRFGILGAIVWIANLSMGQSLNEFVQRGMEKNDITSRLPSIDSLIQVALENSPRLKYFDADAKYWEGKVKVTGRSWLNSIYLDASYGYGIFDNLSNQQIAGDPEASQALFTTEQSRFNLGVSMKMPLHALFNRKIEVKTAQAEVERAKYEKEFAIRELEMLVTQRFHEVVRAHRMLLVASSIVESYKLQALNADKNFTSGVIDITEYTRLQQMLNESLKTFEFQKSEYEMALSVLEGIVGIKIEI
ncbi:MAG: TolC family protein [Bacteroidota bacterium]